MKLILSLTTLLLPLVLCDRFLYVVRNETLHDLPFGLLTHREPHFYGPNVTVPFNKTLGCGGCVRGGYIYCYKGVEGQIHKELDRSNSKCCQTEDDCKGQINSNAWSCTNIYTDPTLAKFACPFVNSSCGPNNTIEFNKTGQTLNITLHIEPGNTCFFDIRAKCGAPAFQFNDTTGLDIEYIDFDDDTDIPKDVAVSGQGNESETTDKS